jgi:predicted alpha/beta-hydrolase family hydrolase
VKKASVRTVATPHGEGRLHTRRATSPIATMLLSHGAGGGVDARDLWALADALPAQGVSVVLFEQPWRVAGRKIATAPPTLDAALRCAADVMRVRTPLVVGGRSAGARSAARTARTLGASGCLALSFPLHAPGKTEPTRLPELQAVGLPTLVVQGERDPMGLPEELPGDLDDLDVVVIPGGDHGLKVPARGEVSQDEAMGIVVESTLEWLVREVVGNPRRG